MHLPWVTSAVFVVKLLIVGISSWAFAANATNCSDITVPEMEKFFYFNARLEVSWDHLIPDANYSVSYCCVRKEGFLVPPECLSPCPRYKQLTDCKFRKLSQTVEQTCGLLVNQYVRFDFVLTVEYRGCKINSTVSSIYTEAGIMRLAPVEKLSVSHLPRELRAEWKVGTKYAEYCFYPVCYRVLESGQKVRLAAASMTKETWVLIPLSNHLNAFELYECCVQVRSCDLDEAPLSEKKCRVLRTPAAKPSLPLVMLCGFEKQPACKTTMDKRSRNVTLLWKLPDKSTWNGIPTEIKITLVLKSTEEIKTTYMSTSGTATNYTLTGLRIDARYEVRLKFASSGGVGPSTAPLVLFEMPPEPGKVTLLTGTYLSFKTFALQRPRPRFTPYLIHGDDVSITPVIISAW